MIKHICTKLSWDGPWYVSY